MTSTELVKPENLSYAALDALDRKVEDFGVEQALLPLKPFVIEGEITYLDWEEYQGQSPQGGPPESEGLKFLIKINTVEEKPFRTGKGVDMPVILKPGLEYPNIYFAKHPKLTFALPDHARFRQRLFATIDPDAKASQILQQLRKQTLSIPVRMVRTYVKTTRITRGPDGGIAKGGSDIFDDSFVFLGKR